MSDDNALRICNCADCGIELLGWSTPKKALRGRTNLPF